MSRSSRSPSPTPVPTGRRESGNDAWSTAASRLLHPSALVGDEGWLWSVAARLAAVTVPWELRPGPLPAGRVWEMVLSTPGYEVWVIGWPPGAGLEPHDHGSSAGAFCVASGELVETVVAPGGAGESTTWEAGEGNLFEPGVVHEVVNEGQVMATSIHVYSPVLSTMRFYDVDGGQVVRREGGVRSVTAGEGPG